MKGKYSLILNTSVLRMFFLMFDFGMRKFNSLFFAVQTFNSTKFFLVTKTL
jgi:hypothetical protein